MTRYSNQWAKNYVFTKYCPRVVGHMPEGVVGHLTVVVVNFANDMVITTHQPIYILQLLSMPVFHLSVTATAQ